MKYLDTLLVGGLFEFSSKQSNTELNLRSMYGVLWD